ncbi:SDR family oxidoreductase [Aquabacterium sp.]|uniref:SDR family oxidoreductase n=1 Tax=Aquabacterium sp. TaxID=1872578 RepID=UPI002C3258E8|nr:SDR family oxidoreductase [Aquabacterium sp.]HSW06741.1 SDR family oxidoreductase [Aquabacterium sp.]
MSIVITGASGQFGRRAVEQLLQRVPAPKLVLVTRRPEALAEFAAQGAQVRRGDFSDPATLGPAFAGAQRLLLISTDAVGGKRLLQHRAAIDAARAAGVQHVVYTSFVGALPGNPAISAIEHVATEQMLRDSGMAWTMLRDSQYSEAMALFAAPGALMSGQWLASAGEGRIGLVSREDCIACAVAVMAAPPGSGHENQVYDITGPELLSYRDCAALAAEIGGRPVAYTVCSDEDKLAFFDALGVPRRIVADEPISGPIPWPSEEMVSFERAIREGHFAILSDAVMKLTGRPPRSLRQVFEQHAAAIRAALAPQ